MPLDRLPHITLPEPPEKLGFTSTSQMGADKRIPPRSRQNHADFLRNRLNQAWSESESEFVASHTDRHGVYVEFKGSPGFDLITKSLEDMRSKKVRLCNVRSVNEIVTNEETGQPEELPVVYATVFISNDKRQAFFEKIEKYATEESSPGKPKNADLINGIADLRKALLIESFWQDDQNLIPSDEPEWCEVWLSSDSMDVVRRFEELLAHQEVNSKSGWIRFPERTVKLVYANRTQLENLTRFSDDIAEYRKAKETAAFWTDQPNREQAEWVENLAERLQVDRESLVSICILDTGVNHGHPLLTHILDSADCHAVGPRWGNHDHDGHGTLMAGVSGYGNLIEILSGSGPVYVNHILESVKILPNKGRNAPQLWGDITSQGISLVEIQAPDRKRVCCMAVTSEDTRDRGKPSSWSGALDQITAGVDDGTKRLMVVSAGNLTDLNQVTSYPDAQILDSIHDPAQSWNALTVGAFTKLDTITDPTLSGFTPIAQENQLSPFSTTSTTWDDKWPIKPEIVMEGGNMAVDGSGFATECDDLCLLSTHYQPQTQLFYPFKMTSAATSQAANFAAKIQVVYPEYWPETVRALMVHSAEWPTPLKQQFARNNSKTEIKKVLRACGYGVPNLDRALYSASNSLTLISQAEIQPFEVAIKVKDGKRKKEHRTRDMHIYDLPWPKEVLLQRHDLQVEMRITLSYFVEPGPGEIGWKDRYRYASHALRFDINSPGEARELFIQRINAAAREEDEGHPGTSSASEHWVIGQARDKGSIHSDIWRGTAADLADSHHIAVFPRIGWWRERSYLGKCESMTRYSLVVSITTPEQEVDIYTPVAQQVGISIPLTITT
jgi:hypothetical protein